MTNPTTVHSPIFLDKDGVFSELADGAIVNIGGTSYPYFTVGGKALLFADGSSTAPGGGTLTLQNVYNNSVAAGQASITLSAGHDLFLYAANDPQNAVFHINADTGKLTLRGDLEVLGNSTVVNSTIQDSDHWLISPASGTTTALRIEPDLGVTPIVDLVSVHKLFGGAPVFSIDKDGNIHSTGLFNGVNIEAFFTEYLAHIAGTADRHTASQIDIAPIASLAGATNVQEALEDIGNQLVNLSGGGYEFVQTTPSTVWVIQHNKSSKRIVSSIYNMDYEQVFPNTVTLTDENTMTVTFASPMTGIAILTIYPGFYK